MAKISMLPESFFDALSQMLLRPTPPPLFQKTADTAAESYCPETGQPLHECRCRGCILTPGETYVYESPVREEPITWPTIPAAPVVCDQEYYGLPCKCPVIHEFKRRLW